MKIGLVADSLGHLALGALLDPAAEGGSCAVRPISRPVNAS